MTATAPTRRPILSWRPLSAAAVIAVWTALGLLSAGSAGFAFHRIGRPVEWGPIVTSRLGDWYTCAMFTPLFVWLARRWPLEGRWWVTRAPAWLLITSLAVPIKYALYRMFVVAFVPSQPARPLGELIGFNFVPESMAFWATIGVIYAVEHYDGLRQRELQAALLRGELAEARLEVLGAQLHPHFLFNTLQGISTLIHRDPGAADRMLARLSDLLRRTLSQPSRPEVPLAEELELLDHYVEIQRVRFQDRLVVERAVPAALAEALVPQFILQPLVENAIQHGIARRAGSGRITITAERRNGKLVLAVTDDGAGVDGGRGGTGGIGLSNTRHRLAALYGGEGALEFGPAPGGGTRVSVILPCRTPDPV